MNGSWRRSRSPRALVVLAAALLAASATVPAAGGEWPERRWSTVERLSLERLRAAHEDAARHRSEVRSLPSLPGLVDYRALFHVHAGDSDHTGGDLEELLAAAKRSGVDILFLSDHDRPPRDFMQRWRGIRDGVLFIPGAEARGFLLHPEESVARLMKGELARLLRASLRGRGLAFLSHLEDHTQPPPEGLTGFEIYNRHADAKDDGESMRQILAWMTHPEGHEHLDEALRRYPVEVYAAQQDYPALYLERWDVATRQGRVVGVGANDCHHNQVFVVKKVDQESVRIGTVVDADEEMRLVTAQSRPGISELVLRHAPGDLVASFDFDPYRVSMAFLSTHVLAPRLEEEAVRDAVAAGRVYVSHDWLADPSGFRFYATDAREGQRPRLLMGDVGPWRGDMTLVVELGLDATMRLLRNGEEVRRSEGSRLSYAADAAGVYRVEAWLRVDGELRPWIYSNPIYLRPGATTAAD